jgi:molecular chaperone DnaK
MEALNAAWQAASQEIYAAQQGAEGADKAQGADPTGGAAEAGADADVSDVEFEEVEDEKK